MSQIDEEVTKKTPAPKTFQVHNTSRSRHNRTLRAAAPEHGGHKQYIGGEHRLVRGRPVSFSAEQVHLHLDELRAKAAVGLIEVRNAHGQKIDLSTGQPVGVVASPSALPRIRLDSIAYDKPSGIPMPQYQGGQAEVIQDEGSLPSLVAGAGSEEVKRVEEVPAYSGKGKKKGQR